MINVLLERTESGALISFKAEGHAGYAGKGFDIACGAVSVLVKTTLQVLEKTEGIDLESDTSRRGFVSFRIKNAGSDSDLSRKLVYAGDFLLAGLESVKEEFPFSLDLKCKRL